MKYLKFIFVLLVAFVSIDAKGQTDFKNAIPFNRIEPIEPTAASLGKYGEYSVSYASGLPGISIPLYNIKSGSLNLDLALSYHGGGLKASEEATWVGLGWDLLFGGAITRQVNGWPDESENFLDVPSAALVKQEMENNPYNFNSDGFNTRYLNYKDLADQTDGGRSFEPDIYNFHFGNYSGKFVLDNNNQPILIPHSALKINFGYNTIEIVTPEGVCYFFEAYDQTVTDRMGQFTTTWYLKSITSPNLHDNITFEYQTDGSLTQNSWGYCDSYSAIFDDCYVDHYVGRDFIPTANPTFTTRVYAFKPKYIYFENGRVSFNLAGSRQDIYSTGNLLQKLSNVEIQKKIQGGYETIKAYTFNYSYFNGLAGHSDYDNLRLKLNSLSEKPSLLDNSAVKTTGFTYYGGENLGYSKKTFDTDYWGYYNAAGNQTPVGGGSVIDYPQSVLL